MARILWLNWSGGGNLPPSLGIARVLTERGHDVVFAGRPEMVPRVDAAGFRAIEITRAYEQMGTYPPPAFLTRLACYLTSPATAEEVRAIVAAESPDLILIDAMFPVALLEAAGFEQPTAVMLHTFIFRQLEMWRGMFARLDGMRVQAGYGSLPPVDELWPARDRIIVTSLAEFDDAPIPGWDVVRHVGPVLEDEKVAVPVSLPWPEDDPTPLVLVSFSTGFEQRSVEKLQCALDALGRLDVHVVATTGGIVDPLNCAFPRTRSRSTTRSRSDYAARSLDRDTWRTRYCDALPCGMACHGRHSGTRRRSAVCGGGGARVGNGSSAAGRRRC